jgi:lipopolysaccharide export system protein LptC
MADSGSIQRAGKARWAQPGSAHDRLVGWSKIALPSAVGVLIAVLMLAPLDKKKVENAPEKLRVEAARYTGTDNKGQQFTMVANRAIQRSSDVPVVDINGMFARLNMTRGPLLIGANHGHYNLDTHKVAIDGPVKVVGPDGYRLATRDVTVDLEQRSLASTGPVSGQMRLGQFQAGRLHADLGERTVTLDGGARLKIVQGAVR